jgi:preprotein translocase subunit SecB
MGKKSAKPAVLGATIDYALAAPISEQVSIRDVRLISSGCSQTPNARRGKHSLEINCEVRTQADKKKGYILVFPSFKLEGFPLERNQKKPDLLIEAAFVIIYKAESLEGLRHANFDAFAQSNGLYNAWPYWREFVQNTVARMNLPPLTIPVFRLLPAKTKRSKAKKTREMRKKTPA